MQEEDKDLVAKTLKDKDIFLSLVERYEGKLLRYINRISSFSKQDSEDILQDVFLKAYQNLNDFDPNISSFNSWIYRIAHNECINRYKKNQWFTFFWLFAKENWSEEEFEINLAGDIDLEKEYSIKHNADIVERILKLLKDVYRNILVLRYFEEKSYEEISDILKIPAWTVATQINRAKKEFKDKLSKLSNKYGQTKEEYWESY